jgi:hypothetical protein
MLLDQLGFVALNSMNIHGAYSNKATSVPYAAPLPCLLFTSLRSSGPPVLARVNPRGLSIDTALHAVERICRFRGSRHRQRTSNAHAYFSTNLSIANARIRFATADGVVSARITASTSPLFPASAQSLRRTSRFSAPAPPFGRRAWVDDRSARCAFYVVARAIIVRATSAYHSLGCGSHVHDHSAKLTFSHTRPVSPESASGTAEVRKR